MAEHIDLIIFDCDGTLVDSEYLNNLATVELLAEQGFPQYDIEYAYEHFIGLKFSTLLQDISTETGHVFPDNMVQRYIARAQELLPLHLKPIEGAKDLILAANKKLKIAVASNGQRDNVLHSLDYTGLLQFFDEHYIVTASDVEKPKPAPDIFLHAAERAGVKPQHALVIEDSVTGGTGALAAGMRVFGFTGAHRSPEAYGKRLINSGISKVYDSLIHIRQDLFG